MVGVGSVGLDESIGLLRVSSLVEVRQDDIFRVQAVAFISIKKALHDVIHGLFCVLGAGEVLKLPLSDLSAKGLGLENFGL